MTAPVKSPTPGAPRLKSRRGTIAVMAALFAIPMLMLCAVSVEYSRLSFVRQQLRRAADAGALAGALQLSAKHDTSYRRVANDFAARNKVLGTLVPTTNSVCGHWNDTTHIMSDTTPCNTATSHSPLATAVATTASANPGFIMAGRLFGGTGGTISVKSVAWAGGSVSSSSCMKPWAISYSTVLWALGKTNPNDYTYQLQQSDIDALIASGQTIKFKTGDPGNPNDTTVDPTITTSTGGAVPGNFKVVDMGPLADANGVLYSPGPVKGASGYVDALSPCVPGVTPDVHVGDLLQLENGNKVGPTQQAMGNLCGGSGNNITCNPPLIVKMAIWDSSGSIGSPGSVKVRYLSGFKIIQSNKGEVTGSFAPLSSEGAFSNQAGLVVKVILVK